MALNKTKLGNFTLYSIETGRFGLDGGAMFGVVPKTLWSKQIGPDDKNRIPMAMRCLLIESEETGRVYLVDNGAGTKFSDKFKSIYQIDHEHSNLLDSLDKQGFSPGDITDLVLTHLHFDHCGGTSYYDENGDNVLRFPNARIHITEKQWKTANDPNARETASFLSENLEPIGHSDKCNLLPENHSFEKGLSTVPVNGHTLGQQLPKIEGNGKTLLFAGDLIPTQVHVPLPWVMGYDMRPVKTLEEKKQILDQAVDEQWFLYLEHDAFDEVITVAKEEGKYRADEILSLRDL